MVRGRFAALLHNQKTRDVLKAILATLLSSLLMFITPIRQAIGPSYYMILLVSGCAHAGKTIGANMELQIQQLLVSACVWTYILIVQAIVYAVRYRDNFETEVYLIHAFSLAIFCFAIATAYAYLPRLNVAIKLNMIAPITSLTVTKVDRWRYNVRPLPSTIYAQLIGIGVSTLVNIFVWPRTSSRELARSFEEMMREMSGCCEFFHRSAAELGTERNSTRCEAVERRNRIRACINAFGETVGGSAYELTIGRFPQSDYRRMFIEANHLAEEFCGMCLPFEIDREFLGKLDSTQQADSSVDLDTTALLSCRVQRASTVKPPTIGGGAQGSDEWVSIVKQGAELSLTPMRELLDVHRRIFLVLIDRFVDLQEDTATKALLWLLSGQKVDIPVYTTCTTGSEANHLEALDLAQIADYLDKHAAQFVAQETRHIRVIGPYQQLMDKSTFNQYTVLMSFIGMLHDNSTAIVRLLRLVDEILQKRPVRSRVWFPRLHMKWLLLGNANDLLNGEFGPEEEAGNNLETAYETDDSTPGFDAETVADAAYESEEDDRTIYEAQSPKCAAKRGYMMANTMSKKVGSAALACMSPYLLSASRWIRKRETQYALKFTLAMMLWGIWAFIGVSHDFFVRNRIHWGLAAITFVYNVSVGSTLDACIKRLIGTVASGLWAIVTWKASRNGTNPYYAYICVFVFCVSTSAMYFYVPRWSGCWMVMSVAYSVVFFTAYYQGPGSDGSRIGWTRLAVNAIAIVYVMVFSSVLAPYKAREALRKRMAELLRLSSLIARSVNFIHATNNEFPAAARLEQQRMRRFMYQFRVVVQQSRALYKAAKGEPSIHGRFKARAHRQLIDIMETQMEWWLYSHSVAAAAGHGTKIHGFWSTLPMREDIIGANCLFNHALELALYTNTRLPMFLPDLRTARHRFVREAQPVLFEKCSQDFEVTSLCRWCVGIWHIVAVQSQLCDLVGDIVGLDSGEIPDEIAAVVCQLEEIQRMGLPVLQHGREVDSVLPEQPYGVTHSTAPLLDPTGSPNIGLYRGFGAGTDTRRRRWFKYIH